MSLECRQEEPRNRRRTGDHTNIGNEKTYKRTITTNLKKIKTLEIERMVEDRSGWLRLLSALCV